MQKKIDGGFESRVWTRARLRGFAIGAGVVGLTGAAVVSCSSNSGDADGEVTGEVYQAASAPVTISFQDGVAPTSAYAGTVDTMIKQASATTNFGTASTLEADGDDGSGVDKSCLIQWNVSQIPAGSTITSASITVQVVDGSSNSYGIFQLVRSWSESQATWQKATSAVSWATAGAMAASDRGVQVGSATGAKGSKTFTLNAAGIAMIQSWVNGATNAGVIVASTSNKDGIDFASSEVATATRHPKLTVTYTPPSDGGTSTGGAPGTGGAPNTGGTATGGAPTGGAPTGGAPTGGAPTGGAPTGGAPTGGAPSTGGAAGSAGVSTDPNLKIGFIGDTDSGSSFTSVLNLVRNEAADALVVEGDMSYSANPTAWWNAFESVMGTSYPVFISRGNHDDSSWSGYLGKAASHLGGATRVAGAHDANYKTTYRGLVIATIKKGDSGANITPFLQGDNHIWKICNWHQNQQAMQIGGKGDEMGWDVYETCRQQGAIIETGHEHSYERTKTLTNMASQVVDPTCAAASVLCVGPGRTFVTVAGLGGNSVRDQTRCLPSTAPYGCNGEWGFIYTNQQSATHGAQFITFNAGSPNHATGYFKNINGVTVESFSINHD